MSLRMIRRLLGLAATVAILSAGILWSDSGASVVSCPTGEQPIAIVGAGIAGLGAAHALLLLECRVIVLEARERLGGRAHTIASGPFEGIEEGARWIHGGHDNFVLRQLFSLLGLSTRLTSGDQIYQSGLHSLDVWFGNGTRLPKHLLLASHRAYQMVDQALARYFWRRSKRRMADITIGTS